MLIAVIVVGALLLCRRGGTPTLPNTGAPSANVNVGLPSGGGGTTGGGTSGTGY